MEIKTGRHCLNRIFLSIFANKKKMRRFAHLHVHSHYSTLDGMSKIDKLIEKCLKNGMTSMALTDHGNMYGAKDFIDCSKQINSRIDRKISECRESIKDEQELKDKINYLESFRFKPILGVEAYCARRSRLDKDKNVKFINPENGQSQIVDLGGWHLILLAKNKVGYQNLCKMVSLSWTEGKYGKPRIDKELLSLYHEGVICTSACLGGEIPQLILSGEIDKARESVLWFKSVFGEDYYLEIQRHQTFKDRSDVSTYQKQQQVIPTILQIAKETGVKVIATNDVHFVEEDEAEAHDLLICISTNSDYNSPTRMHYTKQEYLKSPAEMEKIFSDIPEAITNTLEIVDKVETYDIDSMPIMPEFDIPVSFGTVEGYKQSISKDDILREFSCNEKGEVILSEEEAKSKIERLGGYDALYRIKLESDYLSKLTWEGAKVRYGNDISDEIRSRIEYELHIMKSMGFPGYFLIVMDYIRAAREELGVSVGPGRGSAAGSVVAYCLRITDIDPLKYDLLFERFLNPDRISLPDIDVDFEDSGRESVLEWIVNKYGKSRVAHIITYSYMKARTALADVGRVLGVPLEKVKQIKELIPDKWDEQMLDNLGVESLPITIENCIKYVSAFKSMANGGDKQVRDMIKYACELEGTIRQVGIHACGVIIGADDLEKFVPLSTVVDRKTNEDIVVTEYDGHVIEQVGLIKMDFLGLSTLSIIKKAVENIKQHRGEVVDISQIPIDDALTYNLYAAGETVAVFQFESEGMQKYLKELQPTVFEDLIAMNALYRPGPMAYIPQFINRKHGRERIVYDIPVMERYLKDTYGITVYQEQVMLLSRLISNFSRGESDTLRKAMGKKNKKTLDGLKSKFIDGGMSNGYDAPVLEKIWSDWEKFASYAFNKSHATCYSWLSYQTAYLKAHYPVEFMAANLSLSIGVMDTMQVMLAECGRMGIRVKCPDINSSNGDFTVDDNGCISFGFLGIKGFRKTAVDAIVEEREKNGLYKNIFDFVERVDMSLVGAKSIEMLARCGAFDSLEGFDRRMSFNINSKGKDVLSNELVKYAQLYLKDKEKSSRSLFDMNDISASIDKPNIPINELISKRQMLKAERELLGVYISEHPLDKYKDIIDKYANTKLSDIDVINNDIKYYVFYGVIVDEVNLMTKNQQPFKKVVIEDYSGHYDVMLFGDSYRNYAQYVRRGQSIMVIGEKNARGNMNIIKIKNMEEFL